MTKNMLKLNDDKTEVLVVTSDENLRKRLNININVGDHCFTSSPDPIRNLGVYFDSKCSLVSHVSKMCKDLNFSLYSLGKIRKFIDKPTAEKLVNATITSKLDHCNSELYGVKDTGALDKLQLIQNNAARIVSLRRKYDHITPVLQDLHWLPVKQRINYKILLMTYKALNGKAPDYISELVQLYVPRRPNMRSVDKCNGSVPVTPTSLD